MSIDDDTRPLALVTGAAQCLGRELALQCARHGLDLVLVDDAPLAELAAQLRTLAERVDYVETHLDSGESIHAIGAAIGGRGIDALCASAERRDRVQCASLFALINRVAQDMSAVESGRILIVSPEEETAIEDYCCALRADLKSSWVTVTCLHATADAASERLAELAFDAMLEGEAQVPAAAVSRAGSGGAARLR